MSAATPTPARPAARRAIPGGKRSAGRSCSRSRQAGTTAVTASAATPSVVPIDKVSSEPSGRPATLVVCCLPSGTNSTYAPITTTLDRIGASAGAANLRCACKIPYRTTASPYSRICGANTASIPDAIGSRSARGQPDAGLAGMSSEITGPAATARTRLAGARITTVQVSSADEIRLTSALESTPAGDAERSADPARIGITMAVSAPPRTMS